MARGKKEKVKLAVLLGLSVSSFQVHTKRLRIRCLSPKPEPEEGQREGGETDGLSPSQSQRGTRRGARRGRG